jgi:hypothetical protein
VLESILEKKALDKDLEGDLRAALDEFKSTTPVG